MTTRSDWIDARTPAPPMRLDPWLEDGEGTVSAPGWTATAKIALERVLRSPGRVRASAFDLLAADALVTYACEAALESDDPDAQLGAILRDLVAPS